MLGHVTKYCLTVLTLNAEQNLITDPERSIELVAVEVAISGHKVCIKANEHPTCILCI